jgi:hypothetical protein
MGTLYYGDNLDILLRYVEDTWEWNSESQRAYAELSLRSDELGSVMRAFMEFLGPNDMRAPRLVEFRRALKPTGSL